MVSLLLRPFSEARRPATFDGAVDHLRCQAEVVGRVGQAVDRCAVDVPV